MTLFQKFLHNEINTCEMEATESLPMIMCAKMGAEAGPGRLVTCCELIRRRPGKSIVICDGARIPVWEHVWKSMTDKKATVIDPNSNVNKPIPVFGRRRPPILIVDAEFWNDYMHAHSASSLDGLDRVIVDSSREVRTLTLCTTWYITDKTPPQLDHVISRGYQDLLPWYTSVNPRPTHFIPLSISTPLALESFVAAWFVGGGEGAVVRERMLIVGRRLPQFGQTSSGSVRAFCILTPDQIELCGMDMRCVDAFLVSAQDLPRCLKYTTLNHGALHLHPTPLVIYIFNKLE
jgi:hypothetical protein